MYLSSLSLKGFRNLKKLELSFDSDNKIYAFIGANGQGKTNILEAIYLCALSKSFRTRKNHDLINFGADFCSIKSELNIDSEEKILEIIITAEPPQKVLKINGVKKKATDFIGQLKAVFFSPDDLTFMAFAPRLRRRYMDVILSQIDRNYLDNLMRYQEIIRQRNALLKKIKEGSAGKDELTFWDDQLAEFGMQITDRRMELVDHLNAPVKNHYQAIAQSEDNLEIKYHPGTEGLHNKEKFLNRIQKSHERDIGSGATQLGPHRDDLHFFYNNHDMMLFASRGEWRSLVLALKFTEIELIHEKTNEQPILLLDDVFSELDETRQKYLFNAISDTQTFITTTHKEFLEGLGVNVQVYKVKEGNVF